MVETWIPWLSKQLRLYNHHHHHYNHHHCIRCRNLESLFEQMKAATTIHMASILNVTDSAYYPCFRSPQPSHEEPDDRLEHQVDVPQRGRFHERGSGHLDAFETLGLPLSGFWQPWLSGFWLLWNIDQRTVALVMKVNIYWMTHHFKQSVSVASQCSVFIKISMMFSHHRQWRLQSSTSSDLCLHRCYTPWVEKDAKIKTSKWLWRHFLSGLPRLLDQRVLQLAGPYHHSHDGLDWCFNNEVILLTILLDILDLWQEVCNLLIDQARKFLDPETIFQIEVQSSRHFFRYCFSIEAVFKGDNSICRFSHFKSQSFLK